MKNKCNWFCILFMVLIFTTGALAEKQPIDVGFGSMSIHANLQAGFNFYVGDETLDSANYQATDRKVNYSFLLNRFRFITKGHIVTDKIRYFTQTEFNASGAELYDLFMSFHYIPYTSLNFGRFVPRYAMYLDQTTADLIFIDYPLWVYNFDIGPGDSARACRHNGFWVHFKHKYFDASLGVWNGFTGEDTDGDGLADTLRGANFGQDTNTGKDITFSVTAYPIDDMDIRLGFWWGQPLAGYETDDGELTEFNNTLLMLNAGFRYRPDWGLMLWTEYHWRQISLADFDLQDDPDPDSYTSQSFFFQAGFNIGHYTGVPFEFVARFDYLDPDMENDEDTPSALGKSDSAHDELMYITGGVNYYIEGTHAVVRLNYIHKRENWKDVLNKKGDDTQTGIFDDVVKLQVQVAF